MVSKGKVLGVITEHYKGDKIRISKFKAKVRYRKTIGFRPYYTKVKVNKITVD
jgi:large subunit ribosomal protein L21